MGLKENFSQAVKELTGIGKAQPAQSQTVDELKRAVEDDSGRDVREITLDSAAPPPMDTSDIPEMDDNELKATVRPLSQPQKSAPVIGEQIPSISPLPATVLSEDTDDEPDFEPLPVFVGSDRPETSIPDITADTVPVESAPVLDSTPAADAFFSGGEVPQSQFTQNTPPPQPFSPPPQNPQPFAREMEQTPPPQPFAQPQGIPPQQFSQQPQNSQQGLPPAFMNPPPSQPNSNYANYAAARNTPVPMPAQRAAGREESNELTVISRNTVVDGNIRSFADMSVDGDIKGDVETTKDIDLNGKIIGNVTCNNAMMHTSQVQGNIRMKGNVSMKRDTLLIGDLMSTYAEVNGKVKGNLDVVGKADLKGDAVVFGDISASTITVEDGAIIQGYVSTTFLNKEESKNLFPEAIVIGESGSSRL